MIQDLAKSNLDGVVGMKMIEVGSRKTERREKCRLGIINSLEEHWCRRMVMATENWGQGGFVLCLFFFL